MLEELKEIIQELDQLDAMKKSCEDFARKLQKRQNEFLTKYLGYPSDEKSVHTFDILQRVAQKAQNDKLWS